MSGIRDPIIRIIKRYFHKSSVKDDVVFDLVDSYFTDNKEVGYIIKHFKLLVEPKMLNLFSGAICVVSEKIKAKKQGEMLTDLNKLFKKLGLPKQCVGLYFENAFLNILIRE